MGSQSYRERFFQSGFLPIILFWIAAFTLYYAASFPYPDWLDSPELAAASSRLGIFHAPGSPLTVIFGYLISFLPAFEKSYSMAAFSPVFAASGVAVFYQMMRKSFVREATPSVRSNILALLASMPLALSIGVVGQAARCEVYTLAFFLSALAIQQIIAIDEYANIRGTSLAKATFFLGLGFSVHPLIALATASGVLPYLLEPKIRQSSFRALRYSIISGLLGCSPILLLPYMSHGLIDVRWGPLDSLQGWFDFIRGGTFVNTYMDAAQQDWDLRLGITLTLLFQAIGASILVAWVALLYVGLRLKWRLSIALLCITSASVFTVFSQKELMLSNPDLIGYLLPAVLAAATLTMKSLQRLDHGNRARQIPGLTIAILSITAVVQIALANPIRLASSCTKADWYARKLLAAVPRDALMVLSDFNLLFYMEYLQRSQHFRPDVYIAYGKQVNNPLFFQELRSHWPDLNSDRLPRINAGKIDFDRLSPVRPVVFDAGPFLGALPEQKLYNSGPLWGTAPFLWSGEKSATESMTAECENPGVIDERFASVISWHSYWSTLLAFKSGNNDIGRDLLKKAYCLRPEDETIQSLAAKSGGKPSCD